jgi:hypothetical protein
MNLPKPPTNRFREGAVMKLPEPVSVACVMVAALTLCPVNPAKAQALPVPCYAFQQDPLGNWSATEPLSMDTPVGMVDIAPGHRVSIPVAKILNARCR